MTTGFKQVLEHLEQAAGLTDGQLLARFIATRDEAAFAALVRRHGPMVLGVCRRVLGNVHDAEDAFQATFLVLARKASAVLKRESVGCWLHGVAYHTALRARVAIARRRTKERQGDMPHPEVAPVEPQDWLPLLDRELNRLPQKYRAAIVACDLEGRTRREAAHLLGIAEGTLSSRLANGRRVLAKRLVRSGLTLSGGAIVVSQAAWGQVSSVLASSTVKAASGEMTAATTAAVLLMNEVVKTMLLKKLRLVVGGVLVMVAVGVVGLGYQTGSNPAVAQTTPRSELDTLRREIELLKLNLEVVLEKVRAQEAELRTLRPKRGAGAEGGRGTGTGLPGSAEGAGSVGGFPGEGGVPGGSGGFPGMPPGGKGPATPGGGLPGKGPGSSGLPGTGTEGASSSGTTEVPRGGTRGTGGGGAGVGSSSGGAPGGRGEAGTRSATGFLPGGESGEAGSDPIRAAEAALKLLREARNKENQRRAAEALENATKWLREQK